MEKIEIRPRFQYSSPLPPEKVLQALEEALSRENAPINGLVIDHHVYLRIPHEDQHFWSPQLALEVEAAEEGSQINGLFGPRESVWLMYIFFYALMAFLSVIVMIMGFSQLNLGLSARILWALPVLLALFVLAYLTARAGQKLGHDEMHLLYDFFRGAVKS
ncbi:hypothetical protein [Flavilitoribacter nigricans]|nr:hypothetical protein [Flavilitoribacter nigricans]